jgi:hypothetical protein
MPIISQTLYSHPTEDPSPVLRVRRKLKDKADDPQDVEDDDPGRYLETDDDVFALVDAEELTDFTQVMRYLGRNMYRSIHNYYMPINLNKNKDLKLNVKHYTRDQNIWLIEFPFRFHFRKDYNKDEYSFSMLKFLEYTYKTDSYKIKILHKERKHPEEFYTEYLAIMVGFQDLEANWTDDVEPVLQNMCRRWANSTVKDWKWNGKNYINLD